MRKDKHFTEITQRPQKVILKITYVAALTRYKLTNNTHQTYIYTRQPIKYIYDTEDCRQKF